MLFLSSPQQIKCYPKINENMDTNIQSSAEILLSKEIKRTESVGGSIVIKNANSDKLVSVVSSIPGYHIDKCGNKLNLALASWEPGSIIKPLLIQTAIEKNQKTIESKYNVKNYESIGEKTIQNHLVFSSGTYSIADISVNSINTGIVEIYKSLDSKPSERRRIWNQNLQEVYGLNKKTGYNITNEDSGYLPPINLKNNPEYRFSLSSFGVGINATPLQLTNAYDIALTNPDKRMKESTVNEFKKLLTYNMDQYKANLKQDSKFKSIGGKTGTSSMINNNLIYTNNDIGSFIGFVENDETAYVIFTQLISPKSKHASKEALTLWNNVITILENST